MNSGFARLLCVAAISIFASLKPVAVQAEPSSKDWLNMSPASQSGYVSGLVDRILKVGTDADTRTFNDGIKNCIATMNASPQLMADRITSYYRHSFSVRTEPVSLAFFKAIAFGDCLPYLNEARSRAGLSALQPPPAVEP